MDSVFGRLRCTQTLISESLSGMKTKVSIHFTIFYRASMIVFKLLLLLLLL